MLDLMVPLAMLDAWYHLWRSQLQAMTAFADATGRITAAFTGARVGDITIYFPFGSGYTQDIDPVTNWGWVNSAKTRRPDVEREIAREVASYGKQLGRMMDLLVAVAETAEGVDKGQLEAVKQLKDRIDEVKAKHGLV